MLCEWKITLRMKNERKKRLIPGVREMLSKEQLREVKFGRREDICLRRLSFIYITYSDTEREKESLFFLSSNFDQVNKSISKWCNFNLILCIIFWDIVIHIIYSFTPHLDLRFSLLLNFFL